VPGSLGAVGGGLVVTGFWPWLALPGPQQAPLAAGAAGALAVAVHGERERVRRQIFKGVWAALAPLTGMSRERDLKVRRWTGWCGSPGSVRIRYASVCEDDHPQWQPQVIGVVQRRLGARYQVAKHDLRRCELLLELVPGSGPVAEDADAPSAQDVRVQRLVRELLGPAAVATPSTDGEQLTSIEVQHEAGIRVATPAQRARVERVISSMLDGRWRARWDLTTDRVRFEVRPTLPRRLDHPILPITDENRYRLFLGMDEDHGHGLWRFREGEPHLLVVGSTGRGKTVLVNTVVMQWIRRGWPARLCDPKRVELIGLRSWPNIEVVATAVWEIIAVIYDTLREMERRYQLIEQGDAMEEDFEPLLLVIDEYRVFYAQVRAWYGSVKGKLKLPATCPVFEQIAVIAAMGRTAGIHLVLGTQRPDAEWLTGEALAVDTPIPTPQGWTTMGELQVGDRVFAEDGRPVLVTAATDVAVGRPCYRVVFSDGSEVVADENHLWQATSGAQRQSEGQAQRALTREQRWPGHAALASRLPALAADDRETTVTEFEQELGGERVGLLRRGLNDGRWGIEPCAFRHGRAGRYSAKVYQRAELITALHRELTAPAPSWRRTSVQVVTTGEMARTLKRGEATNWAVQVTGPLDLPEADLPIDPWLLGYWLGDGHKAGATIATADMEVLERIRSLGYRVRHYARYNYGIVTGPRGGGATKRHTLVASLRELGLLHDKHIPAAYLRASARQRAQLLAGLLDADGTCAVRCRAGAMSGQVSFFAVDRRLIDGVYELAASLGFIPTINQVRRAGVETTPSSVAFGSPLRAAWKVTFTPDRQVFGIARKQRKLEPALDFQRRPPTHLRYVVDIQRVESVPVRCITVDSDEHLFLAGRAFIPTHNCRDNFRARVSLGPMSPDGARMMWDSVHIGTGLPRGIPGRATLANEAGTGVEAQTPWTPDPRRSRDPESLALLAQLRPTSVAHGPRVVVPRIDVTTLLVPEGPEDESNLNYRAWELASLVPVDVTGEGAADAPSAEQLQDDAAAADLRPLGVPRPRSVAVAAGPGEAAAPDSAGAAPGSASSSVSGGSAAGSRPAFRLIRGGEPAAVEVDELDELDNVIDEEDDFQEPIDVVVEQIQPGDLVLVEGNLDGEGATWGVVEACEEDPLEEDLWRIDWRGDTDERGQVGLPAGEYLTVRHPSEADA
jgi:hypothetical protein